jgi:hypothetical protein
MGPSPLWRRARIGLRTSLCDFPEGNSSMRMLAILALLSIVALALPREAAADDAYGAPLCKKYMGDSAPCACVGPVLEEEYDEEELAPLLLLMKTFMDGLAAKSPDDEQKAQKVIEKIESDHGKSTVEDWMKRYDGIEKGIESSCKWKW